MTSDAEHLAQLIRLALGELPEEKASSLRAQIALDPSLEAKWASVRLMMDGLPGACEPGATREMIERAKAIATRVPASTELSWLESIRHVVANLIADTSASVSFAGLRGGSSTRQLAFDSERLSVDIRLLPPRDTGGSWRLLGFTQGKSGERATSVMLLGPGGGLVTEEPVSVDGEFELSCAPGLYDMLVRVEDEGVRLSSVRVP